MLNNRRNTQEKRGNNKKQSDDQGPLCKISGWNSDEFNDYLSYGILNYFKQSKTRCQSFYDEDIQMSKPVKTFYNDENQPNPKIKTKSLPKNTKAKHKSQSQSKKNKVGYQIGSQNESKEIKHGKNQQEKQTRRDSSCRVSNFTQRMMSRKQYPKSIFQFKEIKKQLEQITKNPMQLSERNSNVVIDDNKAMKVLPRIKPFLNANKLFKLQSLTQKKLSPIVKSSRKIKHTNSQFIEQLQPVFDDQKIYCVSVHCLDD